MKFHLPILGCLILFTCGYCNGSNCVDSYSDMLTVTQSIGALATEVPVISTVVNTINVALGLGGGDSCLLQAVDYRIQQQSAKDRARDAILSLRGVVQSISDSSGCKNDRTPERCIESIKNSYTMWEGLRLHLFIDHHRNFDIAFNDDSFDDPALYAPFVLHGQLELMLSTILYELCGRNETSSVRACNRDKMRDNKTKFKRAFKFFLRVATDLYGYRTMKRFEDTNDGIVARNVKLAGDKILRPIILKWIDRLKDRKFRSIMDIGGNDGTWRTNPATYLESKQFWADNLNIRYPYRRAGEEASSFPPVPIRSSDWISLRCRQSRITTTHWSSNCYHSMGAGCPTSTTTLIGGQDSWLSCWGDTKGHSFGEYCKFRRCPHIMAGQNWGTCSGEHFQIQSIYQDNALIKSGQKIGLRYEPNYWLSRYQGSVLDGYGMNLPCPGSRFGRSDTIGCIYETWSISKANGTNNEIIRHGDLVDIPGLNQCFIFKHVYRR